MNEPYVALVVADEETDPNALAVWPVESITWPDTDATTEVPAEHGQRAVALYDAHGNEHDGTRRLVHWDWHFNDDPTNPQARPHVVETVRWTGLSFRMGGVMFLEDDEVMYRVRVTRDGRPWKVDPDDVIMLDPRG